ncbi:MAG TPA: AMP-binding protein [Marmoricola sp.]|nr:AMP-binding protein [Marmoricola sp.]
MTIVHTGSDTRTAHGFDLRRHGDAPAVVLAERVVSHQELDDLVRDRARLLGDTRRLVLIEAANALEPLVTYLAALAGGHPALLVPPRAGAGADQWQRLLRSYDPDVLLLRDGGEWLLEEQRTGTRHELHPDLALLLGTSGSTGTPKLVRLSHDNLHSNAAAIASYLDLGPSSRAATTLPLQYCYGLSVVNSHLLAGGSLWLTDSSVVDPGFWDAFARNGATTFAGVPYTFDLLERSGHDWASVPSLRQVTQAGGALPAGRVRALARTGRRHGFDFFVMYGQTEATARMAYLPAHLAEERAGTIGVPVEGGELRIERVDCSGGADGELVYSGPNVMLGYAESPADLALGRTVHELRTGDLAVQHDDGLYEITGRCNRLAKLFGTRLDLDLVEQLLGENGIEARAVATDLLVAFVRSEHQVRRTRQLLQRHHCLPPHAVDVRVLPELPVTGSGKPDYGRLRELALAAAGERPGDDVAGILATVLGRAVTQDDSFAGLGGDSLSYVEVSVRLERLIGDLPTDWPQLSVRELTALNRRPRRHLALLETPVLLRAVAIVLIVGSHTELFDFMGGAHVLLGLVGYNIARFALSAPSRRERVARLASTVRDVLVPTVVWVGGVALLTGKYDWSTAVMLNEWLGSDHWNDQWQFWFLDVVVWGTVGVILLLAVPGLDRLERRHRFAVPLLLLAGTLCLRWALTGDRASSMELYQLGTAAWCLALGWLIAAARTFPQRVLVTALVLGSVLGYFGDTHRELVVVTGLLALVWVPTLPVPRMLVRPVSWVAAASFFIYLTHWVVYPPLDADHDFWAAVASVAGGLVAWQAYVWLRQGWGRAARRVAGPVAGRVALARGHAKVAEGAAAHPTSPSGDLRMPGCERTAA